MSEAIVEFSKVVKTFGAAHVLRGLDLEIRRGEFFGLAGVNGAGKTTLIKCLLDLCSLESGSIEIFGVPHLRPQARSRLAFLPERFVPPYYLTGSDFLRYALKLQGKAYVREDVSEMLGKLDLGADALRKPVRAYSKGMTQKLGLAATFLSKRELMVLDEPMSGLDPKARACLKAILAELRSSGHSLFFTSHSLTDIEEICDRMVVLHRGVPYFAGTPRQLCQDFGDPNKPSIEQAFLRCIEADRP